MYLPEAFENTDRGVIVETCRRVGFGQLISAVPDAPSGLDATPVPFLVDDALTTVTAHLSRANQHWRSLDGATALLIVAAADAYISPRWYPSKAEHGKVVPTWNYETVHVHGTVTVHHDPAWLRDMVDSLTDLRERRLVGGEPWRVDDAPDEFVDRQLRAIVGIELTVTAVEAKRKLSQNKSVEDREGAANGLLGSYDSTDRAIGSLMAAADGSDPGQS